MINNKDNLGNELSKEQIEYFKNSKIVDSNDPGDFDPFDPDELAQLIDTEENEPSGDESPKDEKDDYKVDKNSFWYKSMLDTIEQSRKYRKGVTFKLDQEDKEYLEKNYPNYSFKVIDLKNVIEKNNLNDVEHGMFSRRAEIWGEEPELYWYSKDKDTNLNSPIRLRSDLTIIDGNHRLYALYNMGYSKAEVLVYDPNKLNESLLLEVSRNQLVNKSKKGKEYSKKNQALGKNRWERKKWSKVANSTREFNSIDMNAFFKKDILTVNVPVKGETDNYIVKIKFEGVLNEIAKNVQANNNKLDYRTISQALSRIFNSGDVYCHCNCLHPATKIKLLDGTTPTVEEMKKRFDSGEKLYVYSTDKNGDFKPGEVEKVWITKETTTFIKVTLDNDKEILTTPEHLYMLRDGSYICAENLKVGDSLMPLYFYNIAKGYETIRLNSQTRKYVSTYKEVANYFKGNLIEEIAQSDNALNKEPKGVAIHHKDFNKNNNNPDNLEIMSSYDHWMYHANLMKNKWDDEEWRQKQINRLKEYAKEWNAHPTEKMIEARKNNLAKGQEHNYDPNWKPIQAEIMRNAIKNWRDNLSEEEWEIEKQKRYTDEWKKNLSNSHKQLWENMSEEEYQRRCQINKDTNAKIRGKLSVAQKEYWDNLDEETRNERIEMNRYNSKKSWEEHPERHQTEAFKQARKNAFSYERTPEIELQRKITKISNVLNKIISNGEIPSPETYEKYRTNGYPKYTKVFKDWKELSDYFKLNHKVVKVEFIELEETPVYDIAVKEWHNFYVDAGVILHNCKDWQYRFNYWSTVQNYNSGQPENRPNRFTWTNSRDDMGGVCKHTALVLANLSWLMKVASVINNYIHYAETYMQRQFADIIFPKIYGVKYPEALQLGMFDRMYLKHSKGVIDAINEFGSQRGRFKKKPKPEINQNEVEIKTSPKQISIFDIEDDEQPQESNQAFKKQTIFDYGVEEPEDKPQGFKPKRIKAQPKIQNKGFKKLSLFDEEESE